MSSQAGESSFVLTRRLADGTVEWIPLDEIPQRMAVGAGEHYTLIDRSDYEAPGTLVAERRGDDLALQVDEAEVLVLEQFFVTGDVAFHPTTDVAGGAGAFAGPPLTPDSPVQSGSPDGDQVVWSAEPGDGDAGAGGATQGGGAAGAPQSGGAAGAPQSGGAAGAPQSGGAAGGSPLLWGGLALGGLGLAVAAGGGGGSGSDGAADSGGDTGGDTGGDVDDADTTAPQITSGDTAPEIAENSGAGQVVYRATATDEGAVTWSLADGGDADAFSIDTDTGAVTLLGNPDYEEKASYSFTVAATDAAGNSSRQTVSLTIRDMDEAAPRITSGATAAPVDENSGPGQVVYDADATGEVTWSLERSGDAAEFRIDSATGEVTLVEDPDHETQSSYAFTVVATDGDGNSSTQQVSLAIRDLDEAAPTITSGATAPAVDENSGPRQAIYTVTSTDDGDVSAGRTTYSLAPGDDADDFDINRNTGAVTLIEDPDFETQSRYDFTVVATDAAGNSSEQAVSLEINDLDDDDDDDGDDDDDDDEDDDGDDGGDAVPPTVVGLGLGADGSQNGILNAGDTVRVTVTMSEGTVVDTSGGTPRIALNIGDDTAFASYASGSGSTNLIFEYTIQAGDEDSDGIRIPPNAVESNGGAMTDGSGNAADLRHGEVPADPAFVVDTAAPTLSSSAPADDADGVPPDQDIVLTFDEGIQAGSGTVTVSDGSDTRAIDVTDGSQVAISANQVTIDPASDLNGQSNYSVRIDGGAFTDRAGNPYAGISDGTTLDFETQGDAPDDGDTAVDTSIVVFDLLSGSSSDHSGRTFDSGVSYDIYIRVDSNDETLSTSGGGPGTWGTWSGTEGLGSDDRIILVGNGDAVRGPLFSVDQVSVEPTAVQWETVFETAAALAHHGTFTRYHAGDTASAALFDTPLPGAFLGRQGGRMSTMYFTNLPAGILTSQGLV